MEKRIVIIDGNSLINRAYYAIQRPMITKEGVYTQGIYGFLTMLSKILNDYEPGYLAVAFDRKAPTFRHEAYEDYKAGRKKMPMELAMQLPLLKDVLTAMRIPILEIDGFEADDIIGTIAKIAEEADLEPLIITGDKDELQLATDKTKVLITKKGISEFEIYDKDAMIEKYGFTPEQFIDYKGLMGDQSDNIPGIPGVGEKTAQKLILEYGSVANLIANSENISNAKLRAKIEDNAQLAMMSRKLAEIHTAVPIEFDLPSCKMAEPDYDALVNLYVKLEFNSFLKKLQANAVGLTNGDDRMQVKSEARAERNLTVKIVKTDEDRKAFSACVVPKKTIVLKTFGDENHKDLPLIYGISILPENQDVCWYFPWDDANNPVKFLDEIAMTNEVKFAGHNLQQDYYALLARGWSSEFHTAFDTAIAKYLLDPVRSNYDLAAMMLEYFQESFTDEKTFMKESAQVDLLADNDMRYAEYGMAWCGAVDELSSVLLAAINVDELSSVFNDAELPLIECLASMENTGFAVDKAVLDDVGSGISGNIEGLTNKIYELSGEEFNINSPAQLGVILFEKLGLPPSKKTKIGYATGADILEKLRDKHEIIDLILEYRTLTKLNGTYIEGLRPLIHKDGKIHAHFQQTVTATGRISCTEPNLQNIPIKQELGRTIRKAFVPKNDEYILVGADYSQIELRVLAHLSEDPELISDFKQNADIHRRTAARVFHIPEDEVTSIQRSRAKAVNFGVIYGMSGFGLSENLSITRKEAEQYIQDYFKTHMSVKTYMDEMVRLCKETGYASTILGRKRRIPEIKAANFNVRQLGERLAMNTPIQGSAADIIKLAMNKVDSALRKEGLKSTLMLQVHDELIIETHRDELETVKTLLKENMETAVQLNVPLIAELNVGENWYELK